MLKKIKTAYHLLFYKTYVALKAISEDGYEDWKALLFIDGLVGVLMYEIIIWWMVVTKTPLLLSRYGIAIPLGLVVINI